MNRHDTSPATVRLVPKSLIRHGPPRFWGSPPTWMTSVSIATPAAHAVRIVRINSGLTRNAGRGATLSSHPSPSHGSPAYGP